MTTRSRAPHVSGLLVLATLCAGTLDIVYAAVYWGLKGVTPLQIAQSVATGLLGKASYDGGIGTAALGLTLHYLMMLAMAAVYFFAARRLPALRRRPWSFGALYGLALYLVMNHVVLPLSAAGSQSNDILWICCSIVAHVLLVGIPIAWFARRALPEENRQDPATG